jgi:hypothetical protein
MGSCGRGWTASLQLGAPGRNDDRHHTHRQSKHMPLLLHEKKVRAYGVSLGTTRVGLKADPSSKHTCIPRLAAHEVKSGQNVIVTHEVKSGQNVRDQTHWHCGIPRVHQFRSYTYIYKNEAFIR